MKFVDIIRDPEGSICFKNLLCNITEDVHQSIVSLKDLDNCNLNKQQRLLLMLSVTNFTGSIRAFQELLERAEQIHEDKKIRQFQWKRKDISTHTKEF